MSESEPKRRWLSLDEWKRQHHIPSSRPAPLSTRVKRDPSDYGSSLRTPGPNLPAIGTQDNPSESPVTDGVARTTSPSLRDNQEARPTPPASGKGEPVPL